MINQKSEQLTVAPDGRAPTEQLQWRQDFPIDWPQDQYVSRREFIKFLSLTSVALLLGNSGCWCRTFSVDRPQRKPIRLHRWMRFRSVSLLFTIRQEARRLLVRVDEKTLWPMSSIAPT